jgi:predicted phage terminase large subunit-like protein
MTDIQALLSKLSPDVLNAELAKRSMHEFIKQCWTTLEPGRVYKDNWHIQAICEHLEAVISGDIRKLIINIPPRHMKSLTCDVAFPCWAWLQKPHLQFMFASYASSLAIRDSVKCRRLINSSFYQNLEPGFEISTDQNQKQRFENSMNGHRISTSVGGALTGEGGDIICFPAHTIVQTEHGPQTISSIPVSTRVWSYNTETEETELKPVTGFFKNPGSQIVEVVLSDGSTFQCTPEHKIWTRSGWVPAVALHGDLRLPCPMAVPTVQRSSVYNRSSVFSFLFGKISESRSCANTRDRLTRNTVLPNKDTGCLSASGDLLYEPNPFRGKAATASGVPGAVLPSVSDVLFTGTVGKVFKTVIERLSVQVSNLITHWTRSYERIHQKLVNEYPVCLSVPAEITAGVVSAESHFFSPKPVDSTGSCYPLVQASNSSVFADKITRKPEDRVPVSVEFVGHVDTTYCLEVKDNHNFVVGRGQGVIVSNCLDDPHNVKDAESEAVRNNTLDWWDTAVQSRLNDPKTGAFIIIMQRVHQNDLTGHILKNALPEDGWYHLCVPAEYEAHHPHPFTPAPLPSITVTEDPRHEEGALLWPQRFGQKEIDSLKHTLGSYAAAGQLQQRPSPKGGGIIRKAWWQLWEKDAFPNFVYVLQSWDTAYETGAHTSYSACTTWGVFTIGSRYHIMIMNRFRDRLPYPELRRVAKEKYADEKPDAVIIEKKASGQSLIQDLRQANIPVITYTPDRDKVARAHVASVMFESGNIWHPDRRWATEVIDMCAMFPAGDGEDIVDTVTQAIIRLRTMWFATNDEDEDDPPEIPEREATIIPFPEAAIYG